MRRKHLIIGLLALLFGSVAAMAFILPSQSGSGSNFAFLPSDLMSVFKKTDAPSNNPPAPGPSNSTARYQPLDISELPELPTDLPITEVTDAGSYTEEGASPPSGGTGFSAKGGSGGNQGLRGTPNANSDGGFAGGGGGGAGGGGGGGGNKPFKMAALTTCTPGVDCEGDKKPGGDDDGTNTCTNPDYAAANPETCPPEKETVENEDPNGNGETCTTEPCEVTECTVEPCNEDPNGNENPNGNGDGCTPGINCPGDQTAGTCADQTYALANPDICIDERNDGNPAGSEPSVAVDEPGTLSLLLVGGLGLWLARRRSKRKAA